MVEGIEKALNQNALYWMVNGDAELDRDDAELASPQRASGEVAGGPGSEMKDICLQTISDVVRSVGRADPITTSTAPPAALQLLQQFDMLEQQSMRALSLRASEELAATSRAGEAAALEEVKQAAEVGFLSDAENIVMQNAQADILDALHERLRALEGRQARLVGAVAEEFGRRRRRVRREVKYLLPHMRQMEDRARAAPPPGPGEPRDRGGGEGSSEEEEEEEQEEEEEYYSPPPPPLRV